jgi:hypothetical protein
VRKSRINSLDFILLLLVPTASPPSPTKKTDPFLARGLLSANPDNKGVKNILLSQMIRAKRSGTWFGLGRMQRSLYSLAMRLDVKLQSPELLKALVSILKRLRQTCDRAGVAFLRAASLAWAISEAAVGWGNANARGWRNDMNFVRYLAKMQVSCE